MSPTENETPQPPPQPEVFDLARAEYSDVAAKEIGLPSLESMKLLKRVAKELAGTPFCPEAFRNAPEAIFAAALTGREMQLAPLQSLRSFWPSPDGRLGMYSQAMMALMLKAGFKFEWHRCDNDLCEVTATRPNGGSSLKTSWGKDDTKTAGLNSDRKMHGKYPVDMAMNRCVGRIFRFLGADLGGNTMYTPEEIQESIENKATDTAPPAIPESTEVKAGARPKAAPVTVEATAEPVTEKVVPIRETPPPTTGVDKPARTVVRTEHLVYCGGKPATTAMSDFEAATRSAQAIRDERKTVTEIELVSYFSDNSTERKMVARFDPEQAVVAEAPAQTEAPAAELSPEDQARRAALEACKARFEVVRAALPAKDDEARKKIMAQFGNGFFGVVTPREWPKNPTDRNAMMDAIEASLERQTDRDFVISSAKKAGEQARIRANAVVVDPIYQKLKWSAETTATATEFRKLWELKDDADFMEYVDLFLKCDEPDAYCYMKMALISGRGTETLKMLREVSKAMGEPYGAVVGSLVKFVGDLTTENLKAIDSGLKKMLAHATATEETPEPAKAETPAAEPADDDEGWS